MAPTSASTVLHVPRHLVAVYQLLVQLLSLVIVVVAATSAAAAAAAQRLRQRQPVTGADGLGPGDAVAGAGGADGGVVAQHVGLGDVGEVATQRRRRRNAV